jgi:hypothetical protein
MGKQRRSSASTAFPSIWQVMSKRRGRTPKIIRICGLFYREIIRPAWSRHAQCVCGYFPRKRAG